MRVAIMQLDIRVADPAGNLERVLDAIERAAAGGARLLVVPEMWPTSFTPDVDAARVRASEEAVATAALAAGRHGVALVGSAYGAPPEGGHPGRPCNRVHVCEGGVVRASYDKLHLFSPTAEHLSFTAGTEPPPIVEIDGVRVAPIVCYDLRFPDVARAAFRARADVLAVTAQWPDTRAAHWDALVAGRAVESQAFVVACNRAGSEEVGRRRLPLTFPGNSRIVAPDGRVLAEGRGGEELLVADLDLDEVRRLRRAVPVHRDERTDVYRRW